MFKVFGEMYKPKQHENLPAAITAKSTLKQSEIDLLKKKIYNTLMTNEDFSFGEMGGCEDAAQYILDEWVEDTQVIMFDDTLIETLC